MIRYEEYVANRDLQEQMSAKPGGDNPNAVAADPATAQAVQQGKKLVAKSQSGAPLDDKEHKELADTKTVLKNAKAQKDSTDVSKLVQELDPAAQASGGKAPPMPANPMMKKRMKKK